MKSKSVEFVVREKKGLTKWQKARIVFYSLVLFIIVVPLNVPVPFAPEIFHDIFAEKLGGETLVFSIFSFVICIFILVLDFIVLLIVRRKFDGLLLVEILAIPLSIFAVFCVFDALNIDVPEKIILMNATKKPEDFRNPYIGYKMLDCREVSSKLTIAFIPRHITIETDYLAFEEGKGDIKFGGSNYHGNWYKRSTGSMWGDELRNCAAQNKSPYS